MILKDDLMRLLMESEVKPIFKKKKKTKTKKQKNQELDLPSVLKLLKSRDITEDLSKPLHFW